MSVKALFACSKCFSRHPFEELSAGQQLCKSCRGSHTVAKCTYCRSEFRQSKGNSSSICKKCEQNVKQYGKPNPCECCNIIAAFIGSKCERCATYELKYGPPVKCDQCKQRCAFDKHDENKKIDGKLLCWLCTLSYKRAVLKARHAEKDDIRLGKKRQADRSVKENSSKKHSRSSDPKQSSNDVTDKNSRQPSNNIGGNSSNSNAGGGGGGGGGSSGGGIGLVTAAAAPVIDPNSSDHVVAMTQLKEQIASLQKRLVIKDKELLEKDKMITELKGKNFTNENELRNKMKESDRIHDIKVDLLNKKVSSLLKEVASLKKNAKKTGGGNRGGGNIGDNSNNSSKIQPATAENSRDSAKDSGGSDNDSPNTN